MLVATSRIGDIYVHGVPVSGEVVKASLKNVDATVEGYNV